MRIFENYFIVQYIIAPLFRVVDFILPKNENYWGFSVHFIKSDQFVENTRAVFEEVKSDQSIHKILFTRDNLTDFYIEEALNYRVVKLKSFEGLYLFMKCKVLFVAHSISMDYTLRYGPSKFVVLKANMSKRKVINLWHGIPFKKLFALWNPLVKKRGDRVRFRRYERKMYSGLICSSEVDAYAMTAMFHPIKNAQVWQTGLPRNDFLLLAYNELPNYLKSQIDYIKEIKKDKKLILYAPTYRQTAAVGSSEYYQFTDEEIKKLVVILKDNNAILGIRLHYFRHSDTLFNIEKYIDDEFIFDLGHTKIPEIAPLIREADFVVSDYSSVFIEAMYLNKSVIAFAYDFEHYSKEQDGVLYDFKMVFPGDIVSNYDELLSSLDVALQTNEENSNERYRNAQRFFYKHRDTSNSKRVVEMVKSELYDF
ncbi:CDP-glycerol glycerophosphotransferase family protein [Flavobacterium sp. NG2]|uniref:CDP-glycerol glycerophosphotransferase family protein n=1 Tax=Flavobacterium sp. NG2 TaxID=3097547 RepID=UPI002A828CE5|nr:CDP-glycerol glycerophosphotransferase family protein [Flavobacterium sp. NG2]WPR71616.1 CDP-glycerol glycerophosphotransferase family protein [Flavobacterium sp. NG2]